MTHLHWCQTKALPHSDAAKRVADTFNLHRSAAIYDSIGKWFASRLDDGRSDNVLYDTKQECVRHQAHNEQHYTFIKIVPTTMEVCEAEVMLKIARTAYDNGFRLADPDDKRGGPELINRVTVEDQLALSKGLATNLILPWSNE